MFDQLFVFSILLFSVFVVPIIAEKTKIPGIVFYILCGMAFRNFIFRLDTIGDTFHIFSEVGKLYLLFIAGLEIDIYLFKKNVSRSLVFGVFTFVIPMTLGTIVIVNLFGYSLIAALLVAGFFASHTILSLSFINKFGIGNSGPVNIAVGATIVSDIALLAILAVIADIARGMEVAAVNVTLLFCSWGLFIAAILYFVPKIARRVFHIFSEDVNAQFLFVFAAACLLSWTAGELRLKPLIGAFFCGLALCQMIPKRSILTTKINFVGNTFFIPFFFISAGMNINLKDTAEFGNAMALGVILTLLAIVTKTIASFIYGKIFKYTNNAIMMTAGMTIQQAATTIACAAVGLEVGIIDETMFNAAMILILFSCSIGEIISVHYGRKYAQSLSDKSGRASRTQCKTLVYIPSVAHCRSLLDFAGHFKHYSRKYIISPLVLTVDNQEAADNAETILNFCMNYADELEEAYLPEMRIANNAMEGVMRAAAETRAGMVLCPFEDHNPALINQCSPRLVFARLTKNISTTKRILVVFMPTSENRSDLILFVAEVKHLAQDISAEIVFYMSERQNKKIGGTIDKSLKDAVKYKIVAENHWNIIKQESPNRIRRKDAIIVSMGTRHKLFRLPSVDRYPFHIANRFGQNSIIAAYPPMSLVGSDGITESTQSAADFEAVETPDYDGEFRNITNAISQNIGAPEDEDIIYIPLLNSLEHYPVELIPNTFMVHAHTEFVDFPRIFVWFQSENHAIKPSAISPRVLIMLLNPLNGSPETHLKTLSRIAGLFMNSKTENIIENSKNCRELVAKLNALDGQAMESQH